MMMTKTGGRWLTVNPKHCDYQLSIVLTSVNNTNTTSLYTRQNRDRETRINIDILLPRHNFLSLVHAYVVLCRHSWYFSISCLLGT